MKIDTAGNYTLRYTAEDECGNETVIDRSLIVAAPRTVLYTDGTFIINEMPADKETNERLHGVATNVYAPFDPNGLTAGEKYIFENGAAAPWWDQRQRVLKTEIGSLVTPTSTAHWFDGFANMTSCDVSNIDTSNVTNMRYMFTSCRRLGTLDVSHFDTSNVTNMEGMFNEMRRLSDLRLFHSDTSNVTTMKRMFYSCEYLTSIDLSAFDTTSVDDFTSMFDSCERLTNISVSGFNVSGATKLSEMFSGCKALTSVDISSFELGNSAEISFMFSYCTNLQTIYASSMFNAVSASSSNDMFKNTYSLKGGAGTTWASTNPTDKTYAHIDGGTSNPGYFTLKPTT